MNESVLVGENSQTNLNELNANGNQELSQSNYFDTRETDDDLQTSGDIASPSFSTITANNTRSSLNLVMNL